MRHLRTAGVAVFALAAFAALSLALRAERLDALAARMAALKDLPAATRGIFSLVYARPTLVLTRSIYRPETFSAHPSPLRDTATAWRGRGGTLELQIGAEEQTGFLADPGAALDAIDAHLPPDVTELSIRDAFTVIPHSLPLRLAIDYTRGGLISCTSSDGVLRLEIRRDGFTADLAGFDLAPHLRGRIACPDLDACLYTGRLEGRGVPDPRRPLALAGEGRVELRFRSASGVVVRSAARVNLRGARAELTPEPGTPLAIAGEADLARGISKLTVDADHFDLGYFGKIFPDAGSIFSDYALDGLGGLHLAVAGTRPVGVVTLGNGVLVGDPGRVNFANLGGEVSFDDDAILLRDFRADYDRTPLRVRGRIGRADGAVDLTVRAEGVPYDKFRSFFTAMGMRIGDVIAGGVFDLTLRVGGTVAKPRIEGEGTFARGRMAFLDDLFEFRQVNGRFTVREGRVKLDALDGFWGDIPFRGSGETGGARGDDFSLRIDFESFAPEDVDSWIMASLSRMNFGRESSAGIRVDSLGDRLDFSVRFNLRAVDANLYPVPGSVTLEAVSGGLEFHREGSGAVSLERGNFAFRGPAAVKLTLPSLSTYPVTVAGEAEGDVTFDERTTGAAAFSGRLAIPSATLSFIDGRYAARRVPVTGFAASFTRGRDLAFAASASLLGGSFSCRGTSRGGDGALEAEGRVSGVSLSAFYEENPRAFDLVSGTLDADFRHRAGEATPFRASVRLRDGSLRNLAVVNELFDGGLENRIYYLPFDSLSLSLAADARLLRIEEAKAEGGDPALRRILSMLKKEIPLLAAAPPEARAFERAFALAADRAAGRAAELLAALRAAGDRHRPLAELLRLPGLETCPPKALLDLWELFGEDPR